MSLEKHLFSLYIEDLIINKEIITVLNQEVIHRITSVLRLKINDQLILFNNSYICHSELILSDKKKIEFNIIKKLSKPKTSSIILLLPLLEKEYMEHIFFAAGQYGIQKIYIIEYEKSHKHWGKPNDWIRAEKLLIAGAEQAKSFSIGSLHKEIIKFNKISSLLLEYSHFKKIILDEHSEESILNTFPHKDLNFYILAAGPEAGFIENEKKILIQDYKFEPYSLGPVVLRACDAINLCFGILNSSHIKK